MTDMIEITVDGAIVRVEQGSTVAAALLAVGAPAFRVSESGEPRAALCGMGTCFECRVTIDGIEQRRACLTRVRPGMRVVTRQVRR